MTERRPDPLTPPSDPWEGAAPVVPTTSVMPDPYVIVVERRRRRRWPWVIGGLAVLSVLCCVGALVLWAPIGREYPAYLELGDRVVAGLSRTDNPEFRQAAADMMVEMYREHGVSDAVAAVLLDPADERRTVILIGATKLFLDPAKAMDGAIRSVGGSRLKDLTPYPNLGGHLTCGNAVDDKEAPVVVCAWIDHGSIGVGIYYGSWTMDECASKLRDIRVEIVRRGQRP